MHQSHTMGLLLPILQEVGLDAGQPEVFDVHNIMR